MSELMKAFSYLSTLRYGLEALVLAMYDNGRTNMVCPEEELYCHYVWVKLVERNIIYIMFLERYEKFVKNIVNKLA